MRERRPKLQGQLEPVEAVIVSGEPLRYAVANTGVVPLMYAFDESIDWATGKRWQRLPLGGWVAAVGMIVEPGQRSDPHLVEAARHLAPGRYRLIKKLSRGHVPEPDSIVVRCEFSVELYKAE